MLARWQTTVTDESGNVLPSAEITVRAETSGSPLATIYSDREGATPLGNPFNADVDGFVAFHALGGAYRITATSGSVSRVWRYVAIGTAQEIDISEDSTVLTSDDIGVTVQAFDPDILTSDDVGSTVQGFDADTLKADTADTLTAGFNATEFDAGTKTTGTYTPDPASGNFQKAVNGGAHTLAPPGSTCSIVIQYTNNGSAGTITTSGFTLVDGDDFTTTSGDDFLVYIVRNNGFSHLNVRALQ